jgi:CheY-like chemotaxis protein
VNTSGNDSAPETSGRVLIVEDDEAICDAFREALEMEGYRVITALNGREALERIQQHGLPDLIFLDMMMPIMNGWQFLEARAQDRSLAAVPVVIVSAAGDKARADNTAGFIKKPADLDSILDLARQHCGRQAG